MVTKTTAQKQSFSDRFLAGKTEASKAAVQKNIDLQAQQASLDRSDPAQLEEISRIERERTGVIQRGRKAEQVSQVEQGILEGARFGEAVVGEGLGRLGEDEKIQETLGRFEDISRTGLKSGELEAQRTQAFRGIDRASQGQSRTLQRQLSRAGVKGGAAGQALIQQSLGASQQKAEVERDLFLKSADVQREGLRDFSSRLGEIKTFDLAQESAERNIVLQSAFGIAQIGQAERSAQFGAQAQAKAAAARTSCFHKDTKILMDDSSFKTIGKMELGDITSEGEVIGLSIHKNGNDMYLYNGIFVSGSHYIYDSGVWSRVKDHKDAVRAIIDQPVIHNIWTTSGVLTIAGKDSVHIFADYEGPVDLDRQMDHALEELNGMYARVFSRKIQHKGSKR